MSDSEGFDSLRSFSKSDGTEANFHSLSHLQELGLMTLILFPLQFDYCWKPHCESAMVSSLLVKMLNASHLGRLQ